MKITAIKTRKFLPPQDNLNDLIEAALLNLKENSIIAFTSKVVSICEGRCLSKDIEIKENLIKQESDLYLEKTTEDTFGSPFTITSHTLIRAAGIDESNGDNFYILLPKNPQDSAKKICLELKKRSGFKSLGVIITDSHSTPLRRGAMGISIGFYGFLPLKDYRNKQDIFGRQFKVEVASFPDALAAAAVLEMGEGSEQTPIALLTDLPKSIKFLPGDYNPKDPDLRFYLEPAEDLFSQFLKPFSWKKGGQSQ